MRLFHETAPAACGMTHTCVLAGLLALVPVGRAHAQASITLPIAGREALPADLYGHGPRGVVLVAHGGYSTNASWAAEARTLADAGFRVLVFETRGAVSLRAGQETACLYDAECMAADVLVAVRFLRKNGVRWVAVLGGSAGGGAAAQASIGAEPGEIDRLVLLAPMSIAHPEQAKGAKLFLTSREDRNADGLRLPSIQDQYARAEEPKRLVILEGAAHGQRLFATAEGPRVMREILAFLTIP